MGRSKFWRWLRPDRHETSMARNSPIAIRLGLATILLIVLTTLGFPASRGEGNTYDTVLGFAILAVPCIAFAALLAQSRWRARYREVTGTWTHGEFINRLTALRNDEDVAGLIDMYRAYSVVRNVGRRKDILRALTRIPGPQSRDTVTAFGSDLVRTDETPAIRSAACDLLATCPEDGTVDVLLAALDDPDSGVRLAAARSLGLLRARVAVPRLTVELGDTDSGVQAGFALAAIGDPRSLPAIEVAAAASHSSWHAKKLRRAADQLRAS